MNISRFSFVPLVLCLQVLLVSSAAGAPVDDKTPITLGHTEQFYSEILGELRNLEVHLPGGFSESTEPYPLVIVLDGGSLFRYTAAFLDTLTPTFFPEMVVVGLPNTDRSRDLNVMDGEASGAANFRLFLEKELLPHLASSYRATGYRILMGHSLAGLFTLHTALGQPRMFSAYIATSPSMASEPGQITINKDLESLNSDSLFGRYLYFCAGSEEGGELHKQVEMLDRALASRDFDGFSWDSDVFDGEGHFPNKGFYQGMRQIFADWAPPTEWFFTGTLEELQEHYQRLGARYGMTVKPPSDIVWSLRSRLERMEKADEHLAATAYHVQQYPKNTARWLVLADIYAARSDRDIAVSTLEEGLEANPGAEDIKARLAELQDR